MINQTPLRIGLVGAGGFGEFCLAAFLSMPEVRIAAVADVDRARAVQLVAKFDARPFFGIDSLLADGDVDIVALNTPPFLHASQGLLTLEAGKHLFCEKPLAIDPADARKMIDLAAERNLSLTVNYVMRHNPFWAAALRLRQSGVLGDLRHLDLINHAAGLLLPPGHWFWDEQKSGGIWIEHGVHFFDAFAWIAGQPARVVSSQQFKRTDGAVDRVEALLQYGRAGGHCYHAFDQSGVTEQTTVRLTFEKAYVTLREWVPTTLEILTTVPQECWQSMLPGTVECTTRPDGRTFAKATSTDNKPAVYKKCVQSGMRDLVTTIRGDADNAAATSLAVTGEDALTSLQTAAEATRIATEF